VRTSFSGRHIVRKGGAPGRSRDRGCKGHRILRRVLVGGRHLGSSRATFFHEKVVKATLAASSRGKAKARKSQSLQKEWRRPSDEHPAEEEEATEVSEARSVSWRRGKKTPTLGELTYLPQRQYGKRAIRGNMAARVQRRSAEAFRVS